MRLFLSASLVIAGCAPGAPFQDPNLEPDPHGRRTIAGAQPKELGRISWFRSEADAQAASRRSGKPILMLFQEVPG